MPELPEVETVVRTLEHQLGQPTIAAVHVYWPHIIARPSAARFAKLLCGRRIVGYGRRGKFLIFSLSSGTLVAHMRMEGKFYVYPSATERDKHTHVVFDLVDGRQVHYNDTRKFGRMWLYEDGQAITALDELGYEPWDPELTGDRLHAFCRHKRLPFKTMLLDQSMIAGIGNIYADEISFSVGIDPCRPACMVSARQWDDVIDNTRRILTQAISDGGTTIRSYTSSLGVTGRFQQHLMVHSRQGEACHDCGQTIVKTFVNGRGTCYCPRCQHPTPAVIGVTGTIGSGKSTFMGYIAATGAPTISCDDINRQLLEEPLVTGRLASMLGCQVQQVDRTYIAARIYKDEKLRHMVETYLHDLIDQRLQQWYQEHADAKVVYVEVPLLFESGWWRRFSCNVLLMAPRRQIEGRLTAQRGLDRQQIEDIVAAQMDQDAKKKLADVVIVNNGTLDRLAGQAAKLAAGLAGIMDGKVD